MGDNIYELTGRALLEDLEDMGVDLDSDEVDTIGGYLSMEAGHVPAPGESFTLRGWTFTVLEADRKLILRLRMEPADSAASRQTAGQDTAQQDGEKDAGAEAAPVSYTHLPKRLRKQPLGFSFLRHRTAFGTCPCRKGRSPHSYCRHSITGVLYGILTGQIKKWPQQMLSLIHI